MNHADVYGFPQFAPLATPLVKHLLEYEEIPFFSSPLHIPGFPEYAEQFSESLRARWSLFGRRVQEKRLHTFTIMTPALQKDDQAGKAYVMPGWLRETLGILMPAQHRRRKKELITAQTLSVWSERHLLRHLAWGQLEAQSVAGVILARQLDETRGRSWLPSAVDADEPPWWCYSQALSDDGKPSPVVPCPFPLPTNLPASTLLWTPWAGAGWDPCWVQIGSLGAIRWAGAHLDHMGRVQWEVSEADLKQWDPEIGSLDLGFLKYEMLSSIAHVALLRLALTRLPPPLLLRHKATRAKGCSFKESNTELSLRSLAVRMGPPLTEL
jgi:hypothetical protein